MVTNQHKNTYYDGVNNDDDVFHLFKTHNYNELYSQKTQNLKTEPKHDLDSKV